MRVWRWPVLIGVLTVMGLIAGLLGEGGFWWWICWAALSLPIVLSIAGLVRARGSTERAIRNTR